MNFDIVTMICCSFEQRDLHITSLATNLLILHPHYLYDAVRRQSNIQLIASELF